MQTKTKMLAALAAFAAVAAAEALPAAGHEDGQPAGPGLAAKQSAATNLPTIDIQLSGKSITVAGALQSGAVDIHSTTTAREGEPTLVHLNPGVTAEQVVAALPKLKDPNNAVPYGSIVFDADAPHGSSSVQTSLPAGGYLALDTEGDDPGKFPHTSFTISRSANPASLPTPSATVHSIDFAYRSPRTLRSGTTVRFRNDGFVAHMVIGVRAKSSRAAKTIVSLLKKGKDKRAQRLTTDFQFFQGPTSHGAVQQQTLHAKSGTWVLVCFMDTQDHREHTQLGMVRRVRIKH